MSMKLIGSILVDIGFICGIVAVGIGSYMGEKLNELDVPFWQKMLFLGSITYWNAFPDFKHRFLLVLAYTISPLGIVLIAIGGGWLGGAPFFWW